MLGEPFIGQKVKLTEHWLGLNTQDEFEVNKLRPAFSHRSVGTWTIGLKDVPLFVPPTVLYPVTHRIDPQTYADPDAW